MLLLASSTLAGTVHAARAQTAPHHRHVSHHQRGAAVAPTTVAPKTAGPVAAPVAAPAPVSHAPVVAGPGREEQISVSGRSARTRSPGGGLMRVETAAKAIQTVTRDYIAKQAPTANIQDMLQMMPSVNIAKQDPFGLYSGQVNVRGFDQSQVGWLLDGAPLNDIGGGQFYANEVLEAEDLETASLEPGSVDISSPVVNASAGQVTATMSNPTPKAGGLFDLSIGSFDTFREYLKLNSGYIGNSGIRAMFAFSHTKGNMWRGTGDAEKFHYDFKVVKDFDNGSHTGLTVSYNDQVNDSFLNPNLTQYRANGYSNNWAANYSGNPATGSNWQQLHVNPFRNVVVAAPTHIVISPKVSIDDNIYFWHGIGNGTGAGTLNASTYMGNQAVQIAGLNGKKSVLALTPSNQEQFRPGNTLMVHYAPDSHNKITGGWWYEYSNEYQYSPYGQINQTTGQPANIWGAKDFYTTTNGQPFFARNFLTLTQVNMLFIEDQMSFFHDKLKIDAGFKDAMVTRRTYDYTPGTQYNRNLHSQEPLPQVGISWNFDRKNQIYVSGSTNFRMPSNTSLVDYYGTAGKQTQFGGPSKPEYDIQEEVGYRYNGDVIIGSVSFFNYNFTNRQISLNYYNNGAQYSSTVNAGGQTTQGVDAQISTRPIWFHLRPYATFEYLHTSIDNNIRTTGTLGSQTVTDYLPTKGKQAVRAPKEQAGLGLDYDDGSFWATADVKYVGKQYASFMNDNSIPQYITNDVAMGYRFKSFGYFKAPQIQLNMSNLTGAKFRNGIYGISNNANATTGVYGSKIAAGSSPSYYLLPPFTAVVTLSTGF